MSDRSIGRWIMNILGCIVAIMATVFLIYTVIRLDLLIQKLMTVIIYLVMGIGFYLMSEYLRSQRWSRKHAKKVLGSEPMHWQKPAPFEQKILQMGLILLIAGILSVITVGGSLESFIWEALFKIAGNF
jgi:hypothetical protein